MSQFVRITWEHPFPCPLLPDLARTPVKKLKLDVETLRVEEFRTQPAVKQDEGTVHARMSGWYSDPCRFCEAYPISWTPNVC